MRPVVGSFAVVVTMVFASLATAAPPIGTVPTPQQIAGWDIDIRPDGTGLPPGSAVAIDGEDIYVERCASCHGEFGEAVGRYPVLMGGVDSLTTEDPVKTVGSYWPYASTVFDYVRRAMPFGHAQSLSNDETYAVTGYLLYLNDLVDEDEVIDAAMLGNFQMPNRDGFIADDRPAPPSGEPCMRDCRGPLEVIGRARVIDVTPDEEAASEGGEQVSALAKEGERLFAMCAACHSLDAGEHGVGPSLHGLVGRNAGGATGFERYSDAMRSAGIVWNERALAAFITKPQAQVAGTNMPFAGLNDSGQVDALVAFLLAQER